MNDIVKVTLARGGIILEQIVPEPNSPEQLEDALDELRFRMTAASRAVEKFKQTDNAPEFHHRRD